MCVCVCLRHSHRLGRPENDNQETISKDGTTPEMIRTNEVGMLSHDNEIVARREDPCLTEVLSCHVLHKCSLTLGPSQVEIKQSSKQAIKLARRYGG